MEERIVLLALRGRDALVIEQLLTRQGQDSHICKSADDLARAMDEGAGAAMVTEESLVGADRGALETWLSSQEPWSDFPFILLATKRSGTRGGDARAIFERLGNVIVLERPIHGETLASAVNSALRARRKQYEARRHLTEIRGVEEQLRQLNGSLETRIAQRTEELSSANNQLMQEVAKRERAQALLVQSQKMEAVGQLTGGIAHDFNNLLTVISGNVEMIERRAADERTARLAGYAREATARAAKLTHQLLAFSRQQRLTLRGVDVNALILGMNDLLERTIGPQFVVEMRLETAATWAMADPNQVELAILNLVINARDAMSEGGVIEVASAVEQASDDVLGPGSFVVIRVKDTGTGIPAAALGKVFDPFFTTKAVGKGTGLGLSQVYGIAEQSGGTARIESVEGRGTTVAIWLPEAPSEADAAPSSDLKEREEWSAGAEVLVVEDDLGVRRFIVESLEELGYSVSEAKDGPEGLARLAETLPHLMIVDFAMPGMTGAEVVKEARRRWPALRIILATGYADMAAVDQVIDPEFVLRKPFQISDLKSAVQAALV